jgi:hypothetical protein
LAKTALPCKPNDPVTVSVTAENEVAAVGVKDVAEAALTSMLPDPMR